MSQRILYIVESLEPCGASRQLALLAAGLPRDAFDVHVCALVRGGAVADELQSAGIPVTILGRRWRLCPRALLRLRSLIVRLQPGLIQTWQFEANTYGRLAAGSRGKVRSIAIERHLDRWKLWPEWLLDQRLARRTACLVANSEAVRDYCLANGVTGTRWEVIPDAAAPPPPSDLSREQFLDLFELPPDARVAIAVGSLRPGNRYKDLIWALDLLKVIDRTVHLLLVGDGPQRARLQRFRHCVQIEDRVHFLGRRNDVQRLLPHCEQFWQAGDDKPLSNALLEAMAAGVPVVIGDAAGHGTIVADGETGLLFSSGDRAGLAKRALRLLENATLAGALGAAGRRRVLDSYGPARMIERYTSLYHQVLA